MSSRLSYAQYSPKMIQKLVDLSAQARQGSIETTLYDLVQIRASQLNECTFCVDMHVKEAKIHGERELRLYHVAVWRESTLFTSQERAALELTEHLTKLPVGGISDALYGLLKEHFSDQQIVDLTYAIGLINVWNRMNAVFRTTPGSLDKMYNLEKAGL